MDGSTSFCLRKCQEESGRLWLSRRWVTSCEGPYPAHVFDTVDTVRDRFNEDINEDGTIEWPLMCNSGEMAAMMNMVSSHEAEFEFDHANFPTLQSWTDTYNTRKLSKSTRGRGVGQHRSMR